MQSLMMDINSVYQKWELNARNGINISRWMSKGEKTGLHTNKCNYEELYDEEKQVMLRCIGTFSGEATIKFSFCLLPRWGQLLKVRICSSRSKFFPLTVNPF